MASQRALDEDLRLSICASAMQIPAAAVQLGRRAKSNQDETIFWLNGAARREKRVLEIEIENQQSREITSETRDLRNRKVSRTPTRRAKIIYIIPPCASSSSSSSLSLSPSLRNESTNDDTKFHRVSSAAEQSRSELNTKKKYKFMPSRLASWISTLKVFCASRLVSNRDGSFFLPQLSSHLFANSKKEINDDKIKLANKHRAMMTWKLYRISRVGEKKFRFKRRGSVEWQCHEKGSSGGGGIDDSTS